MLPAPLQAVIGDAAPTGPPRIVAHLARGAMARRDLGPEPLRDGVDGRPPAPGPAEENCLLGIESGEGDRARSELAMEGHRVTS